jgi:rhomboid protease GluP
MKETSFPSSEPIQPTPVTVRLPLPLSRPLLSWVILGLNAIVWLLMTLNGGSTDTGVLIRFGAKVPWLVATGEYWRLFTAIFLHIGFIHLAFNSYALYSLGPQIEGLFGRDRFLVIYLLSGSAGSVASYLFSESLSAGASGAIFGLIGALAAYLARQRDILGRRGQRRLTDVVVVILYNLVLSFTVPGIDVLGHLGGLAGGLLVGWLLCPHYEISTANEGTAAVVDRNSLGRQAWRLVLVGLALVAGTGLGTLRWQDAAQTHLMHGVILLEEKAFGPAQSELQQAVARDPQNAQALFYLGVAHQALEQYAKATAAYERALSVEPDLPEVRWNLALAYVKLYRYPEAIEQFRAYLDLAPDGERAAQVRDWLAQLEP